MFALEDLAVANPRLSRLAAVTHTRPTRHLRRGLVLLNLLLLTAVVIGAGIKVAVDMINLQEPEVWGKGLPLEAAEYLRDHDPPGFMFNSYNWGGYLIWSLYPDRLVFIDGRTDLYALTGTVLEDYSQVHWIRPGWPWQAETIAVLLHKRNIWYELHGWSPKYHTPDLKHDIARRLQDRILFGGDYPLFTYERLVSDWQAEGYKPEILQKVFHGNAERFFDTLGVKL